MIENAWVLSDKNQKHSSKDSRTSDERFWGFTTPFPQNLLLKLVWGFAQAIRLRHINKVFFSILFYSFHSIPFHSIPFYSILFYSTKFRSIGIQITFFVLIQSIRVQIKEEQVLESSPLQSGALNFQSIPITASGGTPLSSHHLPSLRITNKDVMFGATFIGTVKSMAPVIIFVFVYSFI